MTLRAYERHAADYGRGDNDRGWLVPVLDQFLAMVRPGGIVLDLGCGPGREAFELAERGVRVVGLDIASSLLGRAHREHPVVGYVRGDMRQLPFESESFDGVWAAASLHHLRPEEVRMSLAEVSRVLRPNGAFYSSVESGETAGTTPPLPGDQVQSDRYYAFYSPGDWRQHVAAGGLVVESLNHAESDPTHLNVGATGWIEVFARRPR
jgi:ubiquinone/menaquinone biosynthesis C-methylase UbiE